jgi:hypothetical protein
MRKLSSLRLLIVAGCEYDVPHHCRSKHLNIPLLIEAQSKLTSATVEVAEPSTILLPAEISISGRDVSRSRPGR